MSTVPGTLSEADWQRRVIDYALIRRWRVSHARPAQVRPGRWATPITGHPGAPDLLLCRDGQVLLVELKRQTGRLTPGQTAWLEAAGGHGRVWRPSDWTEVQETLQ